MAAFIAKQLVGKQLDSVKGAVGGGDDKADSGGGDAGEDPEVVEARREIEEKRKEKHRKMEAEREDMRQEIRDKYNIKKKADNPFDDPGMEGRLGRKRKTPAELAAEANADEEEGGLLPANLSDLASKPGELVGKVTEKCTLQ